MRDWAFPHRSGPRASSADAIQKPNAFVALLIVSNSDGHLAGSHPCGAAARQAFPCATMSAPSSAFWATFAPLALRLLLYLDDPTRCVPLAAHAIARLAPQRPFCDQMTSPLSCRCFIVCLAAWHVSQASLSSDFCFMRRAFVWGLQ